MSGMIMCIILRTVGRPALSGIGLSQVGTINQQVSGTTDNWDRQWLKALLTDCTVLYNLEAQKATSHARHVSVRVTGAQ